MYYELAKPRRPRLTIVGGEPRQVSNYARHIGREVVHWSEGVTGRPAVPATNEYVFFDLDMPHFDDESQWAFYRLPVEYKDDPESFTGQLIGR